MNNFIELFSIHQNELQLFNSQIKSTKIDFINIEDEDVVRITDEFWTAKQRQANSLHEISYRACFKPQLPNFFIEKFTKELDIIYDPFTGRGTTIIEAALLNRNVISNDVNPLSTIFTKGRLYIPNLNELKIRLDEIKINENLISEIDLSMFYEKKTLNEILSLKMYFLQRIDTNTFDELDLWIKMVATNRLTGHSKGFFSVYTLPPNQAVSPDRQIKINEKMNQSPDYRNVKEIILKKSKSLIKDVENKNELNEIRKNAKFYNEDASQTNQIQDGIIQLTVTSPPFLDVVQYAKDNWLRCWFNSINVKDIENKITMSKTLEEWSNKMYLVFEELFRITKKNGFVAFEVGEIRNGKIKLDEEVVKVGVKAGFKCLGIIINEQQFTKTSNIWGVSNNGKGTNTNRIVIFEK